MALDDLGSGVAPDIKPALSLGTGSSCLPILKMPASCRRALTLIHSIGPVHCIYVLVLLSCGCRGCTLSGL